VLESVLIKLLSLSKKVLIISFTFPPQAGIGGRRWAKFFKHFKRSGVDAKVLTSEPFDHNSLWTNDIEAYTNDIETIPTGYPQILRQHPSSIVEKIGYRFSKAKLELQSNGNVYDHSIGWAKSLLPIIRRHIDNGYTTIIATGGPFHYLSDLLILKDEYKSNIQLVADFRDPWANNKTSFGYAELSNARLLVECRKEKVVIERFDKVVTVASNMTSYFMGLSETKEHKFHTILNGFDPEENLGFIRNRADSEFRFVFVGTVYNKTLMHVQQLSLALNNLKMKDVSFHFYGDMSNDVRETLSQAFGVCIHGSVSLVEAKQAVVDADACMLLLTDDITYSFSTKFCEYISFQKPIWVISNDGKTSQYVLENEIGIHSTPETASIHRFLEMFVQDKSVLNSVGYQMFNSEQFSLEHLSKMYLNVLKTNQEPFSL
jgi:glycosyltransferase involved in cell wall biosynthesis